MIETKRLRLRPLNGEELLLSVDNPDLLDERLGLDIRHEKPLDADDHVHKVMVHRAKILAEKKERFLWYANWAIIEKSRNVIVGGIMIKSEPVEGKSEIGYGTDLPYRNNGYMGEAIGGLVPWMFQNNGDLICVTAITNKDNGPSENVLSKNGFEKSQLNERQNFWQLKRSGNK